MIENVMSWFQAHQEVLEQFGTLSLILLATEATVETRGPRHGLELGLDGVCDRPEVTAGEVRSDAGHTHAVGSPDFG